MSDGASASSDRQRLLRAAAQECGNMQGWMLTTGSERLAPTQVCISWRSLENIDPRCKSSGSLRHPPESSIRSGHTRHDAHLLTSAMYLRAWRRFHRHCASAQTQAGTRFYCAAAGAYGFPAAQLYGFRHTSIALTAHSAISETMPLIAILVTNLDNIPAGNE